MNMLIAIARAGIGGGLRHATNLAVVRLLPGLSFPLSTVIVNVLGSFAMDILIEVFAQRSANDHPLSLFLTTGVLGGFTTFSTFSLDAISLYERGEFVTATLYVLGSVLAAMAGLVAALFLMRTVFAGEAA